MISLIIGVVDGIFKKLAVTTRDSPTLFLRGIKLDKSGGKRNGCNVVLDKPYHLLFLFGLVFSGLPLLGTCIVPEKDVPSEIVHPGKLTAGTPRMEVWFQMIFLFNRVIFRFQP